MRFVLLGVKRKSLVNLEQIVRCVSQDGGRCGEVAQSLRIAGLSDVSCRPSAAFVDVGPKVNEVVPEIIQVL